MLNRLQRLIGCGDPRCVACAIATPIVAALLFVSALILATVVVGAVML